MKELTIGSIAKVNIEGEITSCIVLSDFMKEYNPRHYINYLGFYGFSDCAEFVILCSIVNLRSCYKTLIGDQVVYVEIQEMSELG